MSLDPDPRRRPRRSSLARLLRRRRPPSPEPGRRTISAPSVIERVKTTLVALKMPRALEVLDVTLRGIERGEIGRRGHRRVAHRRADHAENRRVRMAVQIARLSAIKTLAGFDFAFQPSLTRPHPCARRAAVRRSRGNASSHRPAWNREDSSRPRPRRRGGQSRPQRLLQLARRHHRNPRQGRTRSRPSREDPLLSPLRPPHRRRDRLPPRHRRRRQSFLPARQRPLRKGRDDPHLKPRLCRMGRHLRRFRFRDGPARQIVRHAVVIQFEGSSYGGASTPTSYPKTFRFEPNAPGRSHSADPEASRPPAKKQRRRSPRLIADRRLGNFAGAPL